MSTPCTFRQALNPRLIGSSLLLGCATLLGLSSLAAAQTDFTVEIRDRAGTRVAGAKVHWVEGQVDLSETSEPGIFALPSLGLRPRMGRPNLAGQEAETKTQAFTADGRRWMLADDPRPSAPRSRLFDLPSSTMASGEPQSSASRVAARVAKIGTTTAPAWITLDISANAFAPRRLAFPANAGAHAKAVLLPVTATLKQKLDLMLGDSLTFKIAWIATGTDGGNYLHTADFADLDSTAGALAAAVSATSWKARSFTDSKGATLPSLSPDGQWVAYETGREATTLATSRVYLQPLSGTRMDGPEYPATNPRFYRSPPTSGAASTLRLMWCSSGKSSGYDDRNTFTLARTLEGKTLTGGTDTLALGSYNAGLSPDGRYLAAGYPRGVILDRQTNQRSHVHVYPGSTGGKPDSLQICNASISQDPARPDRMLFIDFGVLASGGYPNRVRPATYAQHQMLLFADFSSEEPGRIADFIDTPGEALAAGKSWEDPEWSTHPDFAVATTRLDDGNAITQPDVYLIRLSTHEAVKLFSSADGSFYMPVAWVGRK